jgi:hypothetical protein
METGIPIEHIEKWFDRLGKDRPVGTADGHWVDSIQPIATPDGVILRIAVRGAETVSLFLNAVVATATIQAIEQSGRMMGWRNDAGDIMTSTPSGPVRWRPKS